MLGWLLTPSPHCVCLCSICSHLRLHSLPFLSPRFSVSCGGCAGAKQKETPSIPKPSQNQNQNQNQAKAAWQWGVAARGVLCLDSRSAQSPRMTERRMTVADVYGKPRRTVLHMEHGLFKSKKPHFCSITPTKHLKIHKTGEEASEVLVSHPLCQRVLALFAFSKHTHTHTHAHAHTVHSLLMALLPIFFRSALSLFCPLF